MMRERVQEKEPFLLSSPSAFLGHQLVNNSQPADLALRKATPIAHWGGPIIFPFISCKISHLLFLIGPAPKLILDSLNSF
jgi:hypothetical protein